MIHVILHTLRIASCNPTTPSDLRAKVWTISSLDPLDEQKNVHVYHQYNDHGQHTDE